MPQCPKELQLIGAPQLLIPGVPWVLLGWKLVWGPPGTFGPDCPESPTPWGLKLWGQSLLRCGPLQTGHGARGCLRCLRAIPLETPLLPTVIRSPSLFTWVPLGIVPQLFQSRSNSHCWGFSLLPGSFFFPIFLFSSSYPLPQYTI